MHTGTVAIAIGVAVNVISGGILPGGEVRLTFYGMPGAPYALERSFGLTPGDSWAAQQTNTAAANGALTFTNMPVVTTNNFWRIRAVP